MKTKCLQKEIASFSGVMSETMSEVMFEVITMKNFYLNPKTFTEINSYSLYVQNFFAAY